MIQRTLASIFLFTLLLTQAAQGLCQLRCDHKPSAQTSCHAMAMPAAHPSVQAEAPCPAPSCPADHVLPTTIQAFQPDVSIHLTHQPAPVAAITFASRFAPTTNSPPRLSLFAQPPPPALPRLTSLRL